MAIKFYLNKFAAKEVMKSIYIFCISRGNFLKRISENLIIYIIKQLWNVQ